MRAFHPITFLALGLVLCACSSEDDDAPLAAGGTTQTSVNPNNPAGAGGAGTSGSAGSPAAVSAGGSEGGSASIGLNPGAAGNDSTGAAQGGSANAAEGGAAGAAGAPPVLADAGAASMSFFVTSVGGPDGGNFGGIDGADAFCTGLATAADPALGAKTWRAYLSTTTENARDRIGAGPWRNFAGRIIANDLDQLHDQAEDGTLNETWPLADTSIALDETGGEVPSAPPDVRHDIITGTLADGTLAANLTCSDWTATDGQVQVGHSNRAGGGEAESWAAAHGNVGCALATANQQPGTVSSGGGRGSIYCFALE
jgi:hypothetical protein